MDVATHLSAARQSGREWTLADPEITDPLFAVLWWLTAVQSALVLAVLLCVNIKPARSPAALGVNTEVAHLWKAGSAAVVIVQVIQVKHQRKQTLACLCHCAGRAVRTRYEIVIVWLVELVGLVARHLEWFNMTRRHAHKRSATPLQLCNHRVMRAPELCRLGGALGRLAIRRFAHHGRVFDAGARQFDQVVALLRRQKVIQHPDMRRLVQPFDRRRAW